MRCLARVPECERRRPVKDYTMRKSGQCSEPSNSRMRDGCFASAAFHSRSQSVGAVGDLPIEPAEGHVTVRSEC